MATGAIGEQAELTLLDAILHLAAGAIAALIEFLRPNAQGGHDKARIGALIVVLGLDDHSTLTRLRTCPIDELAEVALWQSGLFKRASGSLLPACGELVQPRVLGQPDDVVDVIALAPTHQ